jgi:hypothetical protein
MKVTLKLGSVYEVEHWRKCGRSGGWIAYVTEDRNTVTYEGLNYALNVAFHGDTQESDWYVALFNDNHTVATGDTYATPGYTEATAFSEGTRPAWTEATATALEITNSANKASFTFTTAMTIYGASLVSDNTKGDTAATATLFGGAKFAASKAVGATDILKVTIKVTAANA